MGKTVLQHHAGGPEPGQVLAREGVQLLNQLFPVWTQEFRQIPQKIGPDESGFTSWSKEAKIARDKFAKHNPKDAVGDPTRVTKVPTEKLRELEKQGKIKVHTPEDVERMMRNSGDKKLQKEAGAIRQQMERNKELLIEGEVPANIQSPLK